MSSVKPFRLLVRVSGEFLRLDPGMTRAESRKLLREQAENLRGPRGGRYVRVNEPYDFQEVQTGEDFPTDVWSFTARVTGKYVRP